MLQRKQSVLIVAPGTVLTKLYFLCNLRIAPASYSVFHLQAFPALCFVTV
jgi:hypothetical protein